MRKKEWKQKYKYVSEMNDDLLHRLQEARSSLVKANSKILGQADIDNALDYKIENELLQAQVIKMTIRGSVQLRTLEESVARCKELEAELFDSKYWLSTRLICKLRDFTCFITSRFGRLIGKGVY